MNGHKNRQTVVVAISGGVDSSVAAALCLERGWQTIGVTLRLRSCAEPDSEQKSCCGSDDAADARNACRKLGIKHHFLDLEEQFEQEILRPAWQAYCHGYTPNPCVHCNARLKFGTLLDFATQLGADGVVTGHHARMIHHNKHCELRRGRDPAKDQSYFLFSIPAERMQKIFFPIGEMTKEQVRNKAAEIGLPNAGRTESQDACFKISGKSFPESLCQQFGNSGKKGEFISPKNESLGKHNGIHQFTIGQRRGLGIALGKPAYVSRINPESGNITVTTNEKDLFADKLVARNLNWLIDGLDEQQFSCLAQIRYRDQATPATVSLINENSVMVQFAKPKRAISPGQSIVFYDEDRVLGGAVIESAEES